MAEVFTEQDLRIMKSRSIDPETGLEHLEILRQGTPYVKLIRPATIGDGVISIPDSLRDTLIRNHRREAQNCRMMKFVPASGAASRMFRNLSRFSVEAQSCASIGELEKTGAEIDPVVLEFFRSIKKFAFFPDLEDAMKRDGLHLENRLIEGDPTSILSYLLTMKGLNYNDLPKALLKFHAYIKGARTALEEHLVEGVQYAKDKNGICRIHFTFSPAHLNQAEALCKQVLKAYERWLDVRYELSFSIQSPSTDTLAADLNNRPWRDEKERIVFRPGGHGALLKNLNECGGDIVFLKNIDNVVPDHLKEPSRVFKILLSGYLISLQDELFKYLESISRESATEKIIGDAAEFLLSKLNIPLPRDFSHADLEERRKLLINLMNRPIRVCGMVRNEGEPGGGPFWVENDKGNRSLQIIESAQVDFSDPEQDKTWNSSTHFNPVDLVCGIRNFQGKQFNLHQFVDRKAVFISKKSYNGRALKALELPGLWNGGMAHWITVFVEVPIETFNPVKVVTDLLRATHQPPGAM